MIHNAHIILTHQSMTSSHCRLFLCTQEKFESTIERYRSEKRRLVKQCEALQATLLLREAEAAKSKAAADQLQGAIATFNLQQRIGNSSS